MASIFVWGSPEALFGAGKEKQLLVQQKAKQDQP
jgi:hypothetical protein